MKDTQHNSGAVLRNATLVLPGKLSAGPLFLAQGRMASSSLPDAWECDLKGHFVFPGLVNAHDHLHLNAFPSLECLERAKGSESHQGREAKPERKKFFPNSYAWMEAFQAYMSHPAVTTLRDVPVPVRHWHGALKNLLCGATTVAHHDACHQSFDDPNFPVRTLRCFGWSHSLGLGLPQSNCSTLRYGPSVTAAFAATPSDRPWIIHLAEGTDSVAASELRALDELGCLAPNTILIHGVGLSEDDKTRLIAKGAGVVWCPGSNLALLGRTLTPRRLFEARRLALGTDARLTGTNDMLEELRLAARQSELSPCELLSLATGAGGRLLGMSDAGDLSPGRRADLLIVAADSHPYETLLSLRRADIRAVVRDGMPAIADPDFADWFAACGLEVTAVRLDGKPKLMAAARLGPPGAAALEPGLEIGEAWHD